MSKTALVTGSAGFIGRHMVKELVSRGYEVTELDVETSDEWTWCDFGSGDALGWFATDEDIFDLTVHCAYHVGGRAAIDGTNTNFAKNLQLDASLFEWAIRTGQKRVLYFSSSAVYPIDLQGVVPPTSGDGVHWSPLQELDAAIDLRGMYDWWGGIDPEPDANYGLAKLVGERLAEDARRSGLNVTVVRPASGCAPDQSLDYPWPSVIGRAMNGDMTVWGNPDQVRDWIAVEDIVLGALAVVDSGTTQPVNLGTGVGTSIRELAEMAFTIANPGEAVPEVVSVLGPEGVFYRVLDPSRLHRYYVPKQSVEVMVRETVSQLGG